MKSFQNVSSNKYLTKRLNLTSQILKKKFIGLPVLELFGKFSKVRVVMCTKQAKYRGKPGILLPLSVFETSNAMVY